MLNKIKYMILMSISFMANAAEDAGKVDADYWTIEGMRSQEFSVGIFIFMIIGVAVFLGIIIHVIGSSSGKSKLKTGEKILLVWIILGVIAAVSFGATQLLHGRLF